MNALDKSTSRSPRAMRNKGVGAGVSGVDDDTSFSVSGGF